MLWWVTDRRVKLLGGILQETFDLLVPHILRTKLFWSPQKFSNTQQFNVANEASFAGKNISRKIHSSSPRRCWRKVRWMWMAHAVVLKNVCNSYLLFKMNLLCTCVISWQYIYAQMEASLYHFRLSQSNCTFQRCESMFAEAVYWG